MSGGYFGSFTQAAPGSQYGAAAYGTPTPTNPYNAGAGGFNAASTPYYAQTAAATAPSPNVAYGYPQQPHQQSAAAVPSSNVYAASNPNYAASTQQQQQHQQQSQQHQQQSQQHQPQQNKSNVTSSYSSTNKSSTQQQKPPQQLAGGYKSSATSNSYTGYDAAVYAAATSYLQSKSTPGGGGGGGGVSSGAANTGWLGYKSNRGAASSGGGGSYGGRGGGPGRGSFPSKRGMGGGYGRGGGVGMGGQQTQQLHYCEVCKVSCAGPQTYKEHLDGQRHKKKEAAAKGGGVEQTLPKNRTSFRCDLCDVTCTGKDTYDAHVRGAKHQKTLKLHQTLGKPIPSSAPVVIPPSSGATTVSGVPTVKFVPGGKAGEVSAAAAAALAAEENIQPVGESYVESQKDNTGKLVTYHCKLCECKFNDVNAKDMHLKGRRHRLAYKKQVDPNLEVEMKASTYGKGRAQPRNNDKMRKELMRIRQQELWSMRSMYSNQMMPAPLLGANVGGPQPLFGGPYGGYRRGPRDSQDDRHVMAKHAVVYPTEDELTCVQKMVGATEKALKGVSDAFAKQTLEDNAADEGDASEGKDETTRAENVLTEERTLKGVMRVGLLATGLLVSGDVDVQLVVICNQKPTRALLSRVYKLLPDLIKAEVGGVAGDASEAAGDTTTTAENVLTEERTLKGVTRVGLLATGLLVSGDVDVQLVVICNQKPTRALLSRVYKLLPDLIKAEVGGVAGDASEAAGDTTTTAENVLTEERTLKGVTRVGLLATGLLVSGDVDVQLVVICNQKPTRALLSRVYKLLPDLIKAEVGGVAGDASEAAGDTTTTAENVLTEERTLKGVTRVGLLATGLLVSGDVDVQLVVICNQKPTRALLSRVYKLLPDLIKAEVGGVAGDASEAAGDTTTTAENVLTEERTLKGVTRVGLLATGLLVSGDVDVQLVVICNQKPTRALLSRVYKLLPDLIKAEVGGVAGDASEAAGDTTTTAENVLTEERTLKGVTRVGLLATGLLVSGDVDVQLVVICNQKPTRALLSRVYKLLPDLIKAEVGGVAGDASEAAGDTTTTAENVLTEERTLKGVTRVGLLATGLLVSGDVDVQLVVICNQKPTRALLSRVYKLLPDLIKAEVGGVAGDASEAAGDTTTTAENVLTEERTLKGVTRVGLLATGLLVSGDVDVQLVVICNRKPTRALLSRVYKLLPDLIKAETNSEDKYEVAMAPAEAALTVTNREEPKMKCTVTFSSVCIRDPVDEDSSAEPADMLPKEKCLTALADLRHAKWFQARCSNLQSCFIVLRIMRDICQRIPTWSPLSVWPLELIVEKVLTSAGEPLSPGDALRRVFEAVASGIILPTGPGLLDPCEKETVDAIGNLSSQQLEDITSSAQHALRLIAYNQLYKILAIDRIADKRTAAERKRPRDIDDKQENGKKDKKEGDTAPATTSA